MAPMTIRITGQSSQNLNQWNRLLNKNRTPIEIKIRPARSARLSFLSGEVTGDSGVAVLEASPVVAEPAGEPASGLRGMIIQAMT